jgi:hypothetical protein
MRTDKLPMGMVRGFVNPTDYRNKFGRDQGIQAAREPIVG